MKKVQIEFDELPFPTLERFGLTREMIEDLPMRVLDDICDGRHSPVLPVRVTDEHGGQIESRSRFAFIRMDNGQVDVVFYPALKSSPLERYDEAQQKQLLDGKAIVADVEMADGRSSKAFVQIDTETKQVMYVPTPIIARNLKVLAEVMRLGAATRSNGATSPSASGTNTPSGATVAGSWTMTATLTTFRKRTTPRSCGTNRRRAANATVRQPSTSKNNQSVDYGTKRILSRRGTCREDAERRIRLARLRQSFLRRLAGGIRPLLRGKGACCRQRIRCRVCPLQGRTAGGSNGTRRRITKTIRLWRYERIPIPGRWTCSPKCAIC